MKTISSVSNTTTTNEKEGNNFLPLKNMSSSSRAKVAIQQQSKSYLEDDYDF